MIMAMMMNMAMKMLMRAIDSDVGVDVEDDDGAADGACDVVVVAIGVDYVCAHFSWRFCPQSPERTLVCVVRSLRLTAWSPILLCFQVLLSMASLARSLRLARAGYARAALAP